MRQESSQITEQLPDAMADQRSLAAASAPVVAEAPIELQAKNITVDISQADAQQSTSAITNAVAPLEPTAENLLKFVSATLCFLNCGINDGSLGALIPYILRSYAISTGWMAIPYGVTFFGWLLAAFFGGYCRILLGPGGVIIAGAGLQLLAQCLRPWTPPFGLFSVTFFFIALGQALQEPQANTFVASLKNAHRWLGILHSSYATGGLVGPLMAAAIASNVPKSWAFFYFVPLGMGVLNLGLCIWAFRKETVFAMRRDGTASETTEHRRSAVALTEFKATVRQKSVWLLSIFFFLYLGAAITAGGWVVEFLATVRHGSLSRVGYISAAYYGGIAAGRLLLAEPTFRFGEKRMLLAYALLALAFQIIFWRVPNIALNAVKFNSSLSIQCSADQGQVMISLMGVLTGPAFATGISVASKLIPTELQPSGLGE
jgi:fucose permease